MNLTLQDGMGRVYLWSHGERNRPVRVYDQCGCGTCEADMDGVGFLSASDKDGNGFTIFIKDKQVFDAVKSILGQHKWFGREEKEEE